LQDKEVAVASLCWFCVLPFFIRMPSKSAAILLWYGGGDFVS
jgi:hypothetical protein